MIERFVKRSEFKDYEDFLNNFEVSVPKNFNFGFDVVDFWAKKEPNRIALKVFDTSKNSIDFTFRKIKDLSDNTAGLLQELGIKKGDYVMLMLKNQYQWWVSMIALHKLGAIAIPAPYSLTNEDIEYRCKEIPIKAVIALGNESIIKAIEKAKQKCKNLKHLISVGPNIPENWIDFSRRIKRNYNFIRPAQLCSNEDIMIVFFTSGTTGFPKMVAHDFVYPLGHIVTAYWQNLNKDTVHLALADTGWGKSVWGKLYGQWLFGATIFVYDFEYFSPQELLQILSDFKITSFCAPPIFYRLLSTEEIDKYNLSNLKQCYTAGEKLDNSLILKWKEQTGIEIKEGYGQTESALIIANFPLLQSKLGSIGKRNPLYKVRIVDENDELCRPGEYGEIVIDIKKGKPLGLIKCYINDPLLTNEIYKNGYYHTRDIGYVDQDGYYWFISRKDDVIKTSGYRVGPYEVESACLSYYAVKECLVTSVEDKIRGQIIKATIVLKEEYKSLASDNLKKLIQMHVKKITAPYKCPRIIEFVNHLPQTSPSNNYKTHRKFNNSKNNDK